MPYSSKAIANYFLSLAEQDGANISPMKLQKLVYFAHGWHLAIYGTPLIDETVQAWEFGPVIPVLYQDFKKFGNGRITEKATEIILDGDSWFSSSFRSEIPEVLDGDLQTFLEVVWDKYKGFTPVQLSNLTHLPNTPWSNVHDANPGRKNVTIPDEDIKAYFEQLP